MTNREKHIEAMFNDCSLNGDIYQAHWTAIAKRLNLIFDEVEQQLAGKNREIESLKEIISIQSKTLESFQQSLPACIVDIDLADDKDSCVLIGDYIKRDVSHPFKARNISKTFKDVIVEHKLYTFPSMYNTNDITLPYVFDLLWDIKSLGELQAKLSSDNLYHPSKDIYETMAEYGIYDNTFTEFLL